MEETVDLYEILDNAVKEVTKKVAKMDFINAGASEIDAGHSSSLVTTAQGDYILTIIFQTSDSVLRGITQNMKRGADVNDDDIPIYAAEYFNILCGHVVSRMNRKAHTDARFGIPQVIKGGYMEGTEQGKKRQALFYCCALGTVKVETFFEVLDNAMQ